MENEGIMALPMEAPMSQQEPMAVSSADAYDAAKTALGMTNPQALEAMKASLREDLADVDLTPREIDQLIDVMEYLTRNPNDYERVVQDLIARDMMDPGDFPDQYDPTFIGAALAVLNELKMSQAAGAAAPMQAGPGPMPMQMAQGGLADVAQYLASRGRNGDTMLAHITPDEARMLKAQGGSGTINPETGLPEYFKKFFKKLGGAVKKALQSPIGRIIGTIALATVLGPAGIGLVSSTATAAALAGGATTLAAGGNLKQALVSAALGYVGGGGTIGGVSPLQSVGNVLPGTAGTALNTGLTTAALGTGAGLVMGMKPSEALKMGATAGLISGGIQALGAPTTGASTSGAEAAAPTSGTEAAGPPAPVAGSTAQGSGQGIGRIGTASQQLGTGLIPGTQGLGFTGEALPFAPGGGELGQGLIPPAPAPGGLPVGANYSLVPGAAGTQFPTSAPQGFFGRMAQGASDLYNQYLSPSRPGLPADAGILQKYGPLTLAGTAVAGAAGAFKSQPGDSSPLYDAEDYIRQSQKRAEDVNKFFENRGFYPNPSTYQPRQQPTPAVPNFPVNPITMAPTVPTPGITQSPGGVLQPYNVAGLYQVPQIYPPMPVYRAKGGPMETTQFPRKTGAINGPGTGTSDSIPAMLSDGEFVFTAKAVRNAGNGSRRKGAARMYKLMKMLEGGPVRSA